MIVFYTSLERLALRLYAFRDGSLVVVTLKLAIFPSEYNCDRNSHEIHVRVNWIEQQFNGDSLVEHEFHMQ